MKRAAVSDLAADAITNLMIWAIEIISPLYCGNRSLSERKMWVLALLRELVSLRNPASAWAHRIILLDKYTMLSKGLVAT
jgi:hypothetical protein